MTGDRRTTPEKLPECADFSNGRDVPTTAQNDQPAPFQYLVLTKFEPNRKQVGRMIERINAAGARRLYALKHWTLIEQASKWVRVYGLQLDEIYSRWITETEKVTRRYFSDLDATFWGPATLCISRIPPSPAADTLKLAAEKILSENSAFPYRASRQLERLCDDAKSAFAKLQAQSAKLQAQSPRSQTKSAKPQPQPYWLDLQQFVHRIQAVLRDRKELRDLHLAQANQRAEDDLVALTRNLDDLGRWTNGGLSYRISRSKFYADLYMDAVKTLRVGNIETWWSTEQFANRGMAPALRSIGVVGERMAGLRNRLQSVKQDIVESSIANQTEATRDNTYQLEAIQRVLGELTSSTKERNNEILRSNLETAKTLQTGVEEIVRSMVRSIRWYGWILLVSGVTVWLLKPFIEKIITIGFEMLFRYLQCRHGWDFGLPAAACKSLRF